MNFDDPEMEELRQSLEAARDFAELFDENREEIAKELRVVASVFLEIIERLKASQK